MYVKKFLWLGIVLVAMSVTLANGIGSQRCNSLNPLLSHERFREIQLDVLSPSHPGVCGGLWQAFGTCCNEHEARSLGRDMAWKLNSYIDRFNDYLGSLKNDVRQQSHSFSRRPLDHPDLQFLKRLTDDSVFHGYTNAARNCWNHLSEVRTTAICSICAGNSRVFFSGDKAWVDVPTCSGILSRCSTFLGETLKLIGGTQRAIQNFGLQHESWVGNFNYIVEHARLMDQLSRFENQLWGQERAMAQADLCNRLLLLKRIPVIQQLADVVRNINGGVRSLLQKADERNGGRMLNSQNFGTDGSRSLNNIDLGLGNIEGGSLPAHVFFNQNDVNLLNAQSSMAPNSGEHPLNMTSRFP